MPKKGWKTHQQNYKVKKKTKLALIAIGALIILLIISQLINFVKLIKSPLRGEDAKKYSWNGQFNLTIAINTHPIEIASINMQEKKVTVIQVPDETFMEVPGGFGHWQLSAIYNLGGDKLLKQSLSSFLGVSVDAVASQDLVGEFHRNLFSGIPTLPKLKTDLTALELARLKIGLMQVRFDKIKKINLLDLGVLDSKVLPDGTRVYVTDPIKLDSRLTDFQDPKLRSENLSIAVFNAAQTPLLAQKAKRIITNLGGNVIVTQNAPKTVAKSYVEGEKSETLARLTQIFGLGCQNNPNCDKIAKEDLGLASLRSQIIVVLGLDFF